MKISIIIPVYNVEFYLKTCLDSVCNQTHSDLEILLINDGSTDNSLYICEEYAKKDSRIKLINQQNKGLSSTVRVGIKEASGEYIGFVDSDDYIELDMYEKMLDVLMQNDVSICVCNYDNVDENGKTICTLDFGIKNWGIQYKKNHCYNFNLLPTLNDGKYLSGSRGNKLFSTKLLLQSFSIADNNIRMGEDIALVTPILMNSDSIYYMNNVFYHYLQRTTSIVHNYNRQNLSDWQDIFDILIKGKELTDYYFNDFNLNMLALFYNICVRKIRMSSLSFYKKFIEYRHLIKNKRVKSLLKNLKLCNMPAHMKFTFFCLKFYLYFLLAVV